MKMAMMQAIEISEAGGPEVLRLCERPVPQAAAGEVLIKVAAAGLNGADLAQRRGVYPPPKGASDIPGLEVSGTIEALGEGVDGFAVGDRVVALLAGGGYAQYCNVPASQVLPLPDHLSFVEGAGLMETIVTVWANVFDIGGLREGETLLVHGGTSGIGTTAIQLAKAFGARVAATSGSEGKAELCRQIGAETAINYKTEEFASIVRERHGGANVVLDIIGGPYLEGNIRAMAPKGRLVFIAFNQGRMGQLDIARVMMNGLTVTGSTLRSRPLAEKARLVSEVREKVWPLVESGSFKPVIDQVFPLAEATAAHVRMESGSHMGKIILTLD
ncbi:NAD(P)H-quinone oxidoreductase [Aquamicrobium sp. cd-1]|uniref:NAD(P)H-quinone oxidoreductase n=2 Tax=Aquamicrobium zhengzhouense TaxID=2781738 RepID=A0ABS0SD83_9HYPH|nr:NAD(P)H-quinone oxidoreductase [Aquamicrobium zhengzhouense]